MVVFQQRTLTSDDLPMHISGIIALSSLIFGACLGFGLYFELTYLFKIGTFVEMLTMGFSPNVSGDLEKYTLKHSDTLIVPGVFVLSFLILTPFYVRRSIKHLTKMMLDLQAEGYTRGSFNLLLYSFNFFIKGIIIYLLAYPCLVLLVHIIVNFVYMFLLYAGVIGLAMVFNSDMIVNLVSFNAIKINPELTEVSYTWWPVIRSIVPFLYIIYKGIRFGAWSIGFTMIENTLSDEARLVEHVARGDFDRGQKAIKEAYS